MIHKILLIFCFTLVLYSSSHAQNAEKGIFVEKVNDAFTSVHTIHKDKNGFLWIGRWDGLYRYDGTNFKSFNHIVKTWTNFAVGSIQEDNAGNLWVGATLHDLLIYNPEKDSTQSIQEIYPEVIIPDLWSEITLHDSIAFIASREKVYIVNNALHSAKTIEVKATYKQYINAIKADDKGNLWVALQFGVLKIRPDLKQDYYPQLITDEFSGILVDIDGSIWIRTISKLVHFFPPTATQKEFPFLKNNDTRLTDGNSAIEQDGKGCIWLGSPSKGGLLRFNPETEKFDFFPHKPDDPNSVGSNYITKLVYTKDDDILWIGTEIGLNKIVFNKQNFNVTSSKFPNQQNFIIESLYQDSDSNLWIRTNDKRIHLITNNQNNSEVKNSWLKKVVSMNPEFYLEDDQSGNLLFIGHNEGLFMINKNNGVLKSINSDLIPTDVTPIKYIGNEKILARVGGSAIIIAVRDTLHVINEIPFKTTGDAVRMIADQYNNILASRGDGVIYILDSTKQEFRSVYKAKEKDPIDFTVYLKDREEVIWIGTAGSGLQSFDLRSQKLKNYGFSDHTIGGILIDDNHNVWVSTNKGLLMLNTKSEIVTRYTSQDGFPSGQIRNDVFLKGKDGKFYVGVFDKVISFDPLKIKAHDFVPNIFITKIKVLNQTISDIKSQYKIVELISNIELKYNQNTLSFEFASLNYAYTDKTIYHYQMTDVDNDWIQSENQQVTYANLLPGTYVFKIKALNSQSAVNPEVKEIKITILPPPWKTWWAFLLYAILFGSLSYVFWRRWITRIQLKSLAAIKSAEAEKLREVSMLKSNFFANISHEFRTPLTLLLAPLENRLAIATDGADKAELELMHRSASRLLTLVNQLLDLSRLEAGSLKLKCIYADLKGAILSISSQFSSMAASKGIIFEVIATKPVSLFFDQDKLEKIITNLLSNAFKFTSSGGTVTLTIDRHGPSKKFKFGTVEINVRDTGTGIGAEHLLKIFDRFYQVDMSNTRAYEGAGIGLSLTRELVDLHHGTIEVRSEIGKGSTFTVHLPLGKDHLKPDEISSISEGDLMSSNPIASHEEILILQEQDHVLLHDSILIIEDNADLRSYIRNEFQHNYKILEAADGEEGFTTAIREIPTLIISDLMMPKKDGLAVCRELKGDERTNHIPIILLTARADIDSKLQGYQQGADDYIAKPFNLKELRARIENLITIRKNLQVKFSQPLNVLPSEIATDSVDGRFLKRAVEIIEAHLTDLSFGVEPFAQEMAVSQTQLYRKLQAVTGSGPNEFIRNIRLHRAADLLRNKAGNVSEVAYLVGFNNLSYFSKVFKEKFGVTPIEFLKNPSR